MDRPRANRCHLITRIAVAALALFGAWFLLTRIDDVLAAVGSLATVRPPFVAAGVALAVLGILNRGFQARAAHRLLDVPARLAPMVELSASSYATNKVVKSAGTAGVLPFLADARRRGESSAKVGAAYASMKVAETFSLCGLIAVAVLASVATGSLRGAVLYGALASLAYAAIVSVAILVFASHGDLAEAVGFRMRSLASSVRARLHRAEPTRGGSVRHELVDVIGRLHCAPASAAPLFATAIIGKLIGIACLVVVLAAFGIEIGLVATALAYMLTLMAAMVGPLPGGLGVAEASLGGMLVSRGIPAATAAAAVMAFRLLDLWLPLLAGAFGGLIHSRRAARERVASNWGADLTRTRAELPIATPVAA